MDDQYAVTLRLSRQSRRGCRTGPAFQRKAVTFILNSEACLDMRVGLRIKSIQPSSSVPPGLNSEPAVPDSCQELLTSSLMAGGSCLRLHRYLDIVDDSQRNKNFEIDNDTGPDTVRRGDQENPV